MDLCAVQLAAIDAGNSPLGIGMRGLCGNGGREDRGGDAFANDAGSPLGVNGDGAQRSGAGV